MRSTMTPQRCRAHTIFGRDAVKQTHLRCQPRLWIRQPTPGVDGKLSLLMGTQLVRAAANNPAGFQPLGRHYDGIKDVGSRDYQQRDWFTFFFCCGDRGCEQLLFVVIENLTRLKGSAANEKERAMLKAGCHDYNILLPCCGSSHDI